MKLTLAFLSSHFFTQAKKCQDKNKYLKKEKKYMYFRYTGLLR